MIDDLDLLERLFPKLDAALPLKVRLSPPLANLITQQSHGKAPPPHCYVTQVSYAGDAGGIMCRLDLENEGKSPFIVSITNLIVDARAAVARDVAVYQRRRFKRLRRLGVPNGHSAVHRAE